MKKEYPMQKIMKKYIDEYPVPRDNVFYFFAHSLADYCKYVEEELDKLRPDSTSLNKLYEEVYMLRQAQYQEELLYGSK